MDSFHHCTHLSFHHNVKNVFRISFLLHQKRHLEDARKRGALDGQENDDDGVGGVVDGSASKKRRRSLKVKKSTTTFKKASPSTSTAEKVSSPATTNGPPESFTDVQVRPMALEK